MALLDVNDLALRRGERLVVDGVSLALERGAALVLRGPNGAGKTTILRALAGFIRPAAGAIMWDGRRIEADADAHRARLGFLGHAHGIKPALSLRENLAFAAACADGASAPLDAAIARWGLARAADLPARA
ncbi:MAG: ATP-binding cassette domain-containing protein, partial [Alphaproteobacteria bacterium]|nr:ATP-binding cassette domain-containing protein [Alphaproteobacteria bacterium]